MCEEILRQLPKNGEVWLCCDGSYVYIEEATCFDNTTKNQFVIVREIQNNFRCLAYPIKEFLGRVNKDLYSETSQLFTFVKFSSTLADYVYNRLENN